MNVNRLLYQVEMSFWATIIPIMSDSPAIQAIMRRFYELSTRDKWSEVAASIFLWSGAGVIFGFVLGIITGLF